MYRRLDLTELSHDVHEKMRRARISLEHVYEHKNAYESILRTLHEQLLKLQIENAELQATQLNELLPLENISESTGLSVRAIKTRIGRGELPALQITSTEYRVRRSDYEAWLDKMRTTGQSELGQAWQSAQLEDYDHEQSKTEEDQSPRNQELARRQVHHRHDGDVSTDKEETSIPRDHAGGDNPEGCNREARCDQGGGQTQAIRRAPAHTAKAHARRIRRRMAETKSTET